MGAKRRPVEINSVTVTVADIPTFGEQLKVTREKMDTFDELIFELIEDLSAENETDVARRELLDKQQRDMQSNLVRNETGVMNKITLLQGQQPLPAADRRTTENKLKKLHIEMDSFRSKCGELMLCINAIKNSQELEDHDVKQHLLELKEIEAKIDKIDSSKLAIEKEVVDIPVDQERKETFAKAHVDLVKAFKEKKGRFG